MNYVIADTHFGHGNIIKYCNRPFRTVAEMDAKIIANINATVRISDTLWHLGDWNFGGPQWAKHYRERIVCQDIRLVSGNHDRLLLSRKELLDIFTTVNQRVFWGNIDGEDVFMSHWPPDSEPTQTWFNAFKLKYPNGIYIHGHTHNNSHRDIHNVSVENIGYTPRKLQDIYDAIRRRPSS